MAASHFRLDHVVALKRLQRHPGDPRRAGMEPVAAKWRAFGWDTLEVAATR
jgi:transketolase